MLFGRAIETERLIGFLKKDTEGRLITMDEMITVASSPATNIWPYIRSARQFMMKNHDVLYGTVRGVGIKRMTAEEIAIHGSKRLKRSGRQCKYLLDENALIAGDNSLSVEARATRDTNNLIAVKHRYDVASVKQIIKIAVQNGTKALANILDAIHRTDKDPGRDPK